MDRVTRRGGAPSAFPNRAESLGLQASLLEADLALDAWRELTPLPAPDEPGIAWITPMLMANLSRLRPPDPWVVANPHLLTLSVLKGRSVTLSAEKILRHLEAAGIQALALKGLALGATVYPSPHLRTVSDLDILVLRRDVFRAFDSLKALGLRSGTGEPKRPSDLRAGHAHNFYGAKKHEPAVDLHWHVLESARADDDDAWFWSGAQSRANWLGANPGSVRRGSAPSRPRPRRKVDRDASREVGRRCRSDSEAHR